MGGGGWGWRRDGDEGPRPCAKKHGAGGLTTGVRRGSVGTPTRGGHRRRVGLIQEAATWGCHRVAVMCCWPQVRDAGGLDTARTLW
jgi:hypothetical protein